MTTEQARRAAPSPMVFPFPAPGEQVRLAYRELHIAINGTEEQKKALGNHALLPRPWEPATCLDPELRHELWEWLEDVVDLAQPRVRLGRLRAHPQLLATAPAPGPRDRGAGRPAPPRRPGR